MLVSGLAERGDLSERNADRRPFERADAGEPERELEREGASSDGFFCARRILTVSALPGSDAVDAEVPERPERVEAGVLVDDHGFCDSSGEVFSRDN